MGDLSNKLVNDETKKTRRGKLFEDDLFDNMRPATRNPGCNPRGNLESKMCTGTKMDKYEGTDFLINGIRTDATTNIENKDNMPFLFNTEMKATWLENFQIGIRNGNSHKQFNTPVIVIGLTMGDNNYGARNYDSRLTRNMICENIYSHSVALFHLMKNAYDAYNHWLQTGEINKPLKKNPKYPWPENTDNKTANSYQAKNRTADFNDIPKQIAKNKEEYNFGSY